MCYSLGNKLQKTRDIKILRFSSFTEENILNWHLSDRYYMTLSDIIRPDRYSLQNNKLIK